MTTVFILRQHAADARRLVDALQSTPRVVIGGVADTLAQARRQLAQAPIDVLACDLRLADGLAIALVQDVDRQPFGAHLTRVLALAPSSDDPLLLETLRAGADSYYVDRDDPRVTIGMAIAEVARGEACIDATVARQVLARFDAPLQRRGLLGMRRAPLESDHSLQLDAGERRLLDLIAQGRSILSIARDNDIAPAEIRRAVRGIYRKMQCDLRSESFNPLAA